MAKRALTLLAALAALAALPACAKGPARVPTPVPTVVPSVVATHPHDTGAFTEGLLVRDGVLIESTGNEGQSVIRKSDIATGRVLARVALPASVFGEGIVDWRDQLLSVVWHGGVGTRWRLRDLTQIGQVRYDGEGWGMTRDARHLILSDGTPVLRFLDPVSFGVVKRLQVTADGVPVARLNELEYVDGSILANVWMTDRIAQIDAATGKVTRWIDIADLSRAAGAGGDAVANGIAWDARARKLYVTGKNWPTLFEVKLPPR